jgi:methionyl-tRNA formyltransferase
MIEKKVICIAGKNRIAVNALKCFKFIDSVDIFICPVDGDNGINGWQPSLRAAASKDNIPTLSLNNAYQQQNLTFLSLEFDKILVVEKFRPGTFLLNTHFSLLPAYKGCFTSIWPIYYGEEKTGVTLHEIDNGIDTGPIIDQEEVKIEPDTTSRQLYEELQDAALNLLQRNVHLIVENKYSSRPQSSDSSSYYSRKSLSKIPVEIDCNATAWQIKNKVNAFYFPEYQTATFIGYNIKACTITANRSIQKPGYIISEDIDSISIATIDFDVILYKASVTRVSKICQ